MKQRARSNFSGNKIKRFITIAAFFTVCIISTFLIGYQFGKDASDLKKSGLSAGEKEIFAISLLWGLAQSSQLNLPIIIDTPLSRLDSHHRDKIVDYY